MTREEVIKQLESLYDHCDDMRSGDNDFAVWERDCEAIKIALSALRPVIREQVERVFHRCPECKSRCGLCIHMGAWDKYGKPYVCEQCVDCSNFKSDQRFCEVCGAPMTDEAVDITMKRLEAMKDGE